jgi:hypothetical protein
VLSAGSIWIYTAKYLNYEDEPEHRTSILQEGFLPSFAFFLVCLFFIFVFVVLLMMTHNVFVVQLMWILFYTGLHA